MFFVAHLAFGVLALGLGAMEMYLKQRGRGFELDENELLLITTTLPETNIAPEDRPSQKETSIPIIHFQVRTVSFREGIPVAKVEIENSQFK